ncbi:TetR/AcrR family transcriptional regulator [Bremerella sp. P1]|uniref:TetR/AcrR family transcriptional regulator n=1 Tax=Bremerella sp. P1 TaxID=3026424 RepID=UPI00236885C5|nr:TetR/AcrR family transcriptional regulator [Bremerella sp. P1]WDI43348.1 TetR/AcrR family transcriptional regulator [Bremerella sp. P1]
MVKAPTRERLIEAASSRFYRDGFRNVGIDQILSDVGISKTAFYKHFESKDDLLLAALDGKGDWLEGLCKQVVWERGGGTPEGQLRAIFDLVDMFLVQDDFHGCFFVRAAMEFPLPTEPVFQAAARNKHTFEEFVVVLAKNCQVKDPEELARKLCLIIEGAYITKHVTQNPHTIELAKELADLAIDDALRQVREEAEDSSADDASAGADL